MSEDSTAYVFSGNQLARTQACEELLDGGTQRLLSDLGVGAGASCLEVGAGGGSIARWLADRVGPTGQVVATDLDVTFLESHPPHPQLEVQQHDVVGDPLPTDTFDYVHVRLVLEHLPQREVALQKLVQALRPGGWLLVEDVDYVSGVPVSNHGAAEHERTQSVRLREFAAAGVDHYFGRKLPACLREQGLSDVGNEGRVWIMEGGSAAARWFRLSMEHLRDRLIATGELSDVDIDRMLGLFEDPTWAAYTPIFVAAWGRR